MNEEKNMKISDEELENVSGGFGGDVLLDNLYNDGSSNPVLEDKSKLPGGSALNWNPVGF